MAAFYVLPFNDTNLANVLAGTFPERFAGTDYRQPVYTTPEEIKEKKHFNYLFKYLNSRHINAKTIVVEPDYISKDYLNDYASYYASCFDDYPKKCNRLHFFSCEFKDKDFERIIFEPQESQEEFWGTYVGYIIAKPIPLKVIGKTVLKTYSTTDSQSSRHYFGTREYSVNIFGNKVSIYSLGFMEQDGVVSVCATSAIWMMLQKASDNNYAILKTPSDITDEADIVGTHGERLFPNKGLSVKQISKAIYRSGLVTEIRTEKKSDDAHLLNNDYIKRVVNAYAPIGIPIILVVKVPFLDRNKQQVSADHAITVCGFKYKKLKDLKDPKEKVEFRADSIEMIYAHDDGWGPFATVEFPQDGMNNHALLTSWSTDKPFDQEPQYTELSDIIIPVYHKIRISYDDVEAVVIGTNRIFFDSLKSKIPHSLNWEISLLYSEAYKRNAKRYHPVIRKRIILQQMPKYIWIARCYIGNSPLCDILFDATDVATGMFAFDAYFYEEKAQSLIHTWLHHYESDYKNFFFQPWGVQYGQFLKEESRLLLNGSEVEVGPKSEG